MIPTKREQSAIVFGTIFSVFLMFYGSDAQSLTIETDSFHESVPTSTVSSFITVETKLAPQSLFRSEIENVHACTEPILCLWSLSRRSRETTFAISSRKTDSVAISRYVSTLSEKVNRDSKNPTFGESTEKTIAILDTGENGLILDESAAVASIRDAIEAEKKTVSLPVKIISPTIGSTDPAELGIRELVAEGTTNFRGSPKNRIFNINRALEQFQGVIIAPNAEFSFVKQLGDVDGEHGYLPELVIKDNKTEPEFGGGICQVSSTMFRTAINAGMKITARRNHAYPVSYYKPYGMDATVYIPAPDFRFRNNTSNNILILSSVEGTSLTFRFYGTKDGRQVEIDGPHILESNPDGSMKTTFSQKVTDSSGTVLFDDTFPSNYKSPSLFPHPQDLTVKPADWSKKQWDAFVASKAVVTAPKPAATGNAIDSN
jgi:vancomycin resistance protein YoaR